MEISLTANYTNLRYPIVEITCLIVYGDKLYCSIIPSGEILEFDGTRWTVAFEIPKNGTDPFTLWAGGFWETWSWVKDGCLYFGGCFNSKGTGVTASVVRFDGRRWNRIDLTETELLSPHSKEEVFAMHEFRDNLYVKTHGGRVYGTANGLDWEHVTTLDGVPELNAIEAHGMAVFRGSLFVARAGAGLYSYDDHEWRGPICPGGEKFPATLSTFEGRLYASFYNLGRQTNLEDRPIVTDMEEGIYDVDSYQYPNNVYVTSNGEDWELFASFPEPVRRMKWADGYLWLVNSRRNAQGAALDIHNSLWRYDGEIAQRLVSVPGVITDIAMYGGKYYVSNAHNPECHGRLPGASVFVFCFAPDELELLTRHRPQPREIHIWKSKRIAPGSCLVESIPCAGYRSKSIYLISEKDGSLDIFLKVKGRVERLFIEKGIPITGGEPFKHTITDGIAWLNCQFHPKEDTVVDSIIYLGD